MTPGISDSETDFPPNLTPGLNKAPEDRQLCFLHIPKTAGTTVEFLLKHYMLGSENMNVIPWHGYKLVEPDALRAYRLISGHFFYDIYKTFPHPLAFFTILRDPIQRSISEYHQEVREGGQLLLHPDPNQAHERLLEGVSIDEYLDDYNLSRAVFNLQTTMLGWQAEPSLKSYQDLMQPMDRSGRVSLDLAKKRIDELAFIGITERIQDSLNLMAYTFGFAPVYSVPNLNPMPDHQRNSGFTPDQLRKLRQLNRWDLELYDYALMIFDLHYDRMLRDLQNRYGTADEPLTVEQMLSRDYLHAYAARHGGLLREIRYDFRELFPREGWNPVEDANDQRWIWSGPKNVSFVELPLDRTRALQIRFQVRNYVTPAVLDSLKLRVNDQLIRLTLVRDTHVPIIYTGLIPPAERRSDYDIVTRFSFEVDSTAFPPGYTAETPGARLLGVALGWIEISPAP